MRSRCCLFGLVVLIGGCQALLTFRADSERTESEAGNDASVFDIDGAVPPVPLEAAANAGFCARQPSGPGTYCSDFDDRSNLQPTFVFGERRIGTLALAASLDAPSQPNALEVMVPNAPDAAAHVGVQVLLPAPASSLRCELKWKLDEAPSATSMDADASDPMDLVAFELSDATGVTQVISLVQQANHDVAFYDWGFIRRIGPTTGWSHVTLELKLVEQETTVALNGGPRTPFGTPLLSAPQSIKVAVGPYFVTSGPWRIYFDDVYCKAT